MTKAGIPVDSAGSEVRGTVANHPSAEKRNRQRIKRTATQPRRQERRAHAREGRPHAPIAAKDPKAAKEALHEATVALDKAASKGVLAKKAASRHVSRLSAQVHKLGS